MDHLALFEGNADSGLEYNYRDDLKPTLCIGMTKGVGILLFKALLDDGNEIVGFPITEDFVINCEDRTGLDGDEFYVIEIIAQEMRFKAIEYSGDLITDNFSSEIQDLATRGKLFFELEELDHNESNAPYGEVHILDEPLPDLAYVETS